MLLTLKADQATMQPACPATPSCRKAAEYAISTARKAFALNFKGASGAIDRYQVGTKAKAMSEAYRGELNGVKSSFEASSLLFETILKQASKP